MRTSRIRCKDQPQQRPLHKAFTRQLDSMMSTKSDNMTYHGAYHGPIQKEMTGTSRRVLSTPLGSITQTSNLAFPCFALMQCIHLGCAQPPNSTMIVQHNMEVSEEKTCHDLRSRSKVESICSWPFDIILSTFLETVSMGTASPVLQISKEQ